MSQVAIILDSIIRSNLKSLFMKKPKNYFQQSWQLLSFFPFKLTGPLGLEVHSAELTTPNTKISSHKTQEADWEQVSSSQDGPWRTPPEKTFSTGGLFTITRSHQILLKHILTSHWPCGLTLSGPWEARLDWSQCSCLPLAAFRQGFPWNP